MPKLLYILFCAATYLSNGIVVEQGPHSVIAPNTPEIKAEIFIWQQCRKECLDEHSALEARCPIKKRLGNLVDCSLKCAQTEKQKSDMELCLTGCEQELVTLRTYCFNEPQKAWRTCAIDCEYPLLQAVEESEEKIYKAHKVLAQQVKLQKSSENIRRNRKKKK
jgi:hypothetical protein